MTEARIYSPAVNQMQSGKTRYGFWVVEFAPTDAKTPDSLMGWAGSGDTRSQLTLKFKTREEAIAYAERAGVSYDVIEPNTARLIKQNYADRFAYDRIR